MTTILNILRQPSLAAAVAALLAALGVEVRDPIWEHAIEIIAMVIAFIGVLLGIGEAGRSSGSAGEK